MGIAPTGKGFTVTGICIHRFVKRIVEEWDCLGLTEQLGVVPTSKYEATAA